MVFGANIASFCTDSKSGLEQRVVKGRSGTLCALSVPRLYMGMNCGSS